MNQVSTALLILAAAGVTALVLYDRKGGSVAQSEPDISRPLGPALDSTLSAQEAEAVTVAIAMENNPSNLLGFSDALTPTFPIAAGLLQTKAKLMGGF